MRATQHQNSSRAGIRTLILGGTLTLAMVLSGCSAVNMTGFSMPVFGLTKKSERSDGMTTSSLPEEEKKANSQKTQ